MTDEPDQPDVDDLFSNAAGSESGSPSDGGAEAHQPVQHPPAAPQQFGRREPVHGPRPDADGYYPHEYYVGPDWMRIIVSGLGTVVVIVALVAGGMWLWDEYEPTDDDDTELAAATPTPIPLIPIFECAGDAEPISEMVVPNTTLISGRTADGRWLAFQNPQAPPLQLWIRSTVVPDFVPTDVGVVPCATSPNEFPTPVGRPTPVSLTVPTLAPTPRN